MSVCWNRNSERPDKSQKEEWHGLWGVSSFIFPSSCLFLWYFDDRQARSSDKKSELLPSDWSSNKVEYALRYASEQGDGQLLLKALLVDSALVFNLMVGQRCHDGLGLQNLRNFPGWGLSMGCNMGWYNCPNFSLSTVISQIPIDLSKSRLFILVLNSKMTWANIHFYFGNFFLPIFWKVLWT